MILHFGQRRLTDADTFMAHLALVFLDQPFGMHTKSDPRATREPELLDETT